MVRGDLFENALRRDSIDALDALVLAVPYSRWKCISDLKNMAFCNPVAGGVELVSVRWGFAAAVEKLPPPAAKRHCNPGYRRRGYNL